VLNRLARSSARPKLDSDSERQPPAPADTRGRPEQGRQVALTVLRRTLSDDAERFELEAVRLKELSHPAIVAHVAHGETAEGHVETDIAHRERALAFAREHGIPFTGVRGALPAVASNARALALARAHLGPERGP
jgi:hypothetical protein